MSDPTKHNITFSRNAISGYVRVNCSTCCWTDVEVTLTKAQLRASVHCSGKEWIEIDPLTGKDKSEAA